MKRAVASRGEAETATEQLAEEPQQVDRSGGEDAEVPMHRQDPVVRSQRGRDSDRNRFLPDAGKPFRQTALTEKDERLLLNETGDQERAVKRPQLGR